MLVPYVTYVFVWSIHILYHFMMIWLVTDALAFLNSRGLGWFIWLMSLSGEWMNTPQSGTNSTPSVTHTINFDPVNKNSAPMIYTAFAVVLFQTHYSKLTLNETDCWFPPLQFVMWINNTQSYPTGTLCTRWTGYNLRRGGQHGLVWWIWCWCAPYQVRTIVIFLPFIGIPHRKRVQWGGHMFPSECAWGATLCELRWDNNAILHPTIDWHTLEAENTTNKKTMCTCVFIRWVHRHESADYHTFVALKRTVCLGSTLKPPSNMKSMITAINEPNYVLIINET